MMKLKKIEGGMYCFLVTFDPRNEVASIADLQAIGASACSNKVSKESEIPIEHARTPSPHVLPTGQLNEAKPHRGPESVAQLETGGSLPAVSAPPVHGSVNSFVSKVPSNL